MSERLAKEGLRARGFLGLCAAGVAGGSVAAYLSGGGWGVLPVIGLAGAMLGCWAGAGLGMLLGLGLRFMGRGGGAFDVEGGLVLGGYGAFLGTVAALVFGRGAQAHYWALGGAALGGAAAGVLGESMGMLTRLMMLSSMNEAERARAMRRAAGMVDENLLWPGEDAAAGKGVEQGKDKGEAKRGGG
jgi:hypothetical protein